MKEKKDIRGTGEQEASQRPYPSLWCVLYLPAFVDTTPQRSDLRRHMVRFVPIRIITPKRVQSRAMEAHQTNR